MTMPSEAGVSHEISPFARSRHRTEAEFAVRELALDARDAWRAVGARSCDRLVATGLEQRPHPLRERRLFLLDHLPRRHGRAAYS